MDDPANTNTNDNAQAGALTPEQTAALEQMSDAELLDAFAEQLMVDKGLKEELDEETFTTLKDDLKDRINFQVNRAVLAQLSDEQLQAVEDQLAGGEIKSEDLDQILAETNIDVAQTTQDVMVTFRDAYLGVEANDGE